MAETILKLGKGGQRFWRARETSAASMPALALIFFAEVKYANWLECLLSNKGNIGRTDSSNSIHIAEEHALRRGDVSFIFLDNARNVTLKPWFSPEVY
jgi:hypothetical protein